MLELKNWGFSQLITKSVDEKLWNVIAKCVVTQSGVSLENVDFINLQTHGVFEAIAVFSQGIMNLDLPDVYLNYCDGISTQSILNLIKDASLIKNNAPAPHNPQNFISQLLAQALADSL